MDWRHMAEMLAAGGWAKFELLNLCVWVKTNGGMGSLYRSRHEVGLRVSQRRGSSLQQRPTRQVRPKSDQRVDYPGANVFKRNGRKSDLDLHPTVKPIAMVADAILDSTNLDDIILDPFLGSGTTLLAAERARRRCHGVELDPLYVDTAIARWERLTQQQARLTSGPILRRRQEREERALSARTMPMRSTMAGLPRKPGGRKASQETRAPRNADQPLWPRRNY
jgi:DNA modification methylase